MNHEDVIFLHSIHPAIQFIAILLTAYNFFLGMQRFRVLHLGRKNANFNWKRHVFFGKISLAMLLAGAFGGMSMVYWHRHRVLMAGIHAEVALMIIPLAIFGLLSGCYMDNKKKKRKLLPFIHGVNNLVVLLLALTQIISGLEIYLTYVLGK